MSAPPLAVPSRQAGGWQPRLRRQREYEFEHEAESEDGGRVRSGRMRFLSLTDTPQRSPKMMPKPLPNEAHEAEAELWWSRGPPSFLKRTASSRNILLTSTRGTAIRTRILLTPVQTRAEFAPCQPSCRRRQEPKLQRPMGSVHPRRVQKQLRRRSAKCAHPCLRCRRSSAMPRSARLQLRRAVAHPHYLGATRTRPLR